MSLTINNCLASQLRVRSELWFRIDRAPRVSEAATM